jgi:hypothetical protein
VDQERAASVNRGRYRTIGVALLVPLVLLAAGAAWFTWSVQRVWDQLDSAAGRFEAPPGFEQVARVRQGTGFCWVSCTGGGEAAVTLVLSTDAPDPQTACRALRRAIVDVAGDDVRQTGFPDEGTCGWVGELGGTATVVAVAGPRSAFDAGSGYRWREEVEPPDSPVVAYVEFNSGIE